MIIHDNLIKDMVNDLMFFLDVEDFKGFTSDLLIAINLAFLKTRFCLLHLFSISEDGNHNG